jgi:hypothetical protein
MAALLEFLRRCPAAASFGLAAVLAAGCSTQTGQITSNRPTLVAAQQRLAQAEKITSDQETQGAEYLEVAAIALNDFQQRKVKSDQVDDPALLLYDRAAADLAVGLPALIQQHPGANPIVLMDRRTSQTDRLQLDVKQANGYSPSDFYKIIPARDIDRRGLLVNVTRPGIGGTVLCLQRSSPDLSVTTRLEPRRGYRVPSTAIIDFAPRQAPLLATVHLYDPDKHPDVQVGKTTFPLGADYSATFAAYSRVNELWIGFYNMIRGENMREQAGLIALQRYDPNKVPVILVHGLLSSAYAWRNVANSLQADPEIRKHYQFWVFSYSTGSFIGYNAMLLRNDLQYAEAKYHLRRIVLIGHSMGGILSRAQATNSGRVFWDNVFGAKADWLYNTIPADSVVKRALIFNADPTIHRIIFIATPHRGSSLATGGIGQLGISLIRVPVKIISLVPKSVVAAVAPNGDPNKYQLPTSINSLSPKNKFLLALADLPIQAPFDSIIGDQGKGNTPNSSDSVVLYSSSHVDGTKSETILPGNHGTVVNMSIPSLRKILREEAGLKP